MSLRRAEVLYGRRHLGEPDPPQQDSAQQTTKKEEPATTKLQKRCGIR